MAADTRGCFYVQDLGPELAETEPRSATGTRRMRFLCKRPSSIPERLKIEEMFFAEYNPETRECTFFVLYGRSLLVRYKVERDGDAVTTTVISEHVPIFNFLYVGEKTMLVLHENLITVFHLKIDTFEWYRTKIPKNATVSCFFLDSRVYLMIYSPGESTRALFWETDECLGRYQVSTLFHEQLRHPLCGVKTLKDTLFVVTKGEILVYDSSCKDALEKKPKCMWSHDITMISISDEFTATACLENKRQVSFYNTRTLIESGLKRCVFNKFYDKEVVEVHCFEDVCYVVFDDGSVARQNLKRREEERRFKVVKESDHDKTHRKSIRLAPEDVRDMYAKLNSANAISLEIDFDGKGTFLFDERECKEVVPPGKNYKYFCIANKFVAFDESGGIYEI